MCATDAHFTSEISEFYNDDQQLIESAASAKRSHYPSLALRLWHTTPTPTSSWRTENTQSTSSSLLRGHMTNPGVLFFHLINCKTALVSSATSSKWDFLSFRPNGPLRSPKMWQGRWIEVIVLCFPILFWCALLWLDGTESLFPELLNSSDTVTDFYKMFLVCVTWSRRMILRNAFSFTNQMCLDEI